MAKSTGRTLFVITLAVVAALGLVQPASAVVWWALETVDDPSTANVGSRSAIALDSAGRPHIAYQDAINFDLKYARKTSSGTWTIETVDAPGVAGWGVSIALDASDTPHISYLNRPDVISIGDLKYAKRVCSSPSSCQWNKQTVHAGIDSNFAGNTSLALDGAGNPHISYFDHVRGKLKWAKWEGFGWGLTDVITTPSGGHTSIALDSNGFPQMAYRDSATGQLRYVKVACYFILCGWAFETVDTAARSPGNLKLDAAGNAHVTYRGSGGSIRYAKRSCTPACSWPTQIVGSGGVSIWGPSLALDVNGVPRIAFTYGFNGTIGHLYYAMPANAGWSVVLVAYDVMSSADVSLAVDASGYPHISYQHQTENSLRYAREVPPPIQLPLVPSAGAIVQ